MFACHAIYVIYMLIHVIYPSMYAIHVIKPSGHHLRLSFELGVRSVCTANLILCSQSTVYKAQVTQVLCAIPLI